LLTRLNSIATNIEKFSHRTGKFISWMTLFMVILVFVVVVMRYGLKMGAIPIQELVIYLHGSVFLLAAGYTLQQDEHVRVDVFYANMSAKNKAWVDLMGTLFLLFPVSGFILYMSFDYVILSWKIAEASAEAAGLPALYLLKSLLLLMPLTLILQGIAVIIRSLQTIRWTMSND